MKTGSLAGILMILCAVATLSCACRGKNRKTDAQGAQTAQNAEPVRYTYKIKNTYPHDPASYTQGLYWHDGFFWESVGNYGNSRLLKVEPETGKILHTTTLEPTFFAEGAALLDGKIYQLTWQNGVAFVYDAATMQKTGEFRYSGEGWGITTDGQQLYMSNGTSRIYTVDPEKFSRKRSVNVRAGRRSMYQLNELEWIEGKIWANVYLSDEIVIIDPATGAVEGVIDLTGILPAEDYAADTDVLNGIAYDPAGKRIFVTGKNWPKLFEIEIVKK